FGTGGATLHDIELMKSVVGAKTGIKASGGIKSTKDAQQFIEAGASRIGTSSGIKIVSQE
ncbi:MAG: 2-deoxyribose-5-phosphate aldolase, partial [Gillisia sp.]